MHVLVGAMWHTRPVLGSDGSPSRILDLSHTKEHREPYGSQAHAYTPSPLALRCEVVKFIYWNCDGITIKNALVSTGE